MKCNYHTHNEMCGHAGGTIEDYVKCAVANQMEEIGMSDHIPYPGDVFGMRMPYSRLEEYINQTLKLKEKYRGQIKVLLGMEAEYLTDYDDYYKQLLEQKGVEYLILGQHFYVSEDVGMSNVYSDMHSTVECISYVKNCIDAMNTGYFAYIAHPDLMFINDFQVDDSVKMAIDMLLNEAVKRDYILELNANGFRRGKSRFLSGERYPYPADFFWKEVAKSGVRTIIGADCHSVDALCDEAIVQGENMARELSLNLVEKLEIA